MNDKYIQLSKKKKLKNPLYDQAKCDIIAFYGPIHEIDFEHQAKNYQTISESILPFGYVLQTIWYAKFTNDVREIRSHFIVKSEENDVYWQKYEASAPGGSQNKLYFYGKEIKTTSWLVMSLEERRNFIDESRTENQLL